MIYHAQRVVSLGRAVDQAVICARGGGYEEQVLFGEPALDTGVDTVVLLTHRLASICKQAPPSWRDLKRQGYSHGLSNATHPRAGPLP